MLNKRKKLRKTLSIFLSIFVVGGPSYAEESSLGWVECLKITKENNFSIKSAELSLKAAKELETSAESGFFPQVTATVSQTRSFNEASSSQDQDVSSGVLSVSQNLFAGFLDSNKIKEAETKTMNAQLDLKLT
ncbi:MAG: TolC family protein, partial [Bdellovibrionales bacterium]|nr:TolC family protein [Bdellovibrionales bacterium]